MALGFGATLGVGAGDRIIGPTETLPPQISVHTWSKRNGEGGGGFGRLFDRGAGTFALVNNNGPTYALYSNNSTNWTFTRPSAGVWSPIGLAVDTTSAANDPVIYLSGSKLTVGAGLSQSGADIPWVTTSQIWGVGNRPSDSARNWDGSLAEFAVWSAILTDAEFAALQQGVSPEFIRPEARIHYLPAEREGWLNKSGARWAVAGTKSPVPHPVVSRPGSVIRIFEDAGASTVTGSVAGTNANDTSSASGTTTVTGTSATTNADDTAFASGSVGSSVNGSVAYTNADDTASASGTTTVTGSATVTNAYDTSAASGTTTVTGSSATANANDTCSASGESDISITGDAACTNSNDISAASGTTTVIGSLAQTNSNDTAAAYGVINNGIVVESALTTGAAITTSIKKPGVPAGTPEWLKTLLETIIGRRGNSIEVPKFQSLTFSDTPTKAECEALYSYTNSIRTAVQDILTRLDS